MRQPGIEPRANAWRAFMLPLHHWRLSLSCAHNPERHAQPHPGDAAGPSTMSDPVPGAPSRPKGGGADPRSQHAETLTHASKATMMGGTYLNGPRKIMCENSRYMKFPGRSLVIESLRLFSRNGHSYGNFREKRMKKTGQRKVP